MAVAKPLFVVSWVLLLALAGLIALGSIGSAVVAFRAAPESITPRYTIEQLAAADPEAATALRGRRVTAATWALAYAMLMGVVALVPYRRGERWAWWALLVSLGVSQLLSILRVLTLGTVQGAGTSGILLALGLLGLMAGAPRLFMVNREP
jgi:hypothetical protein